MEMEISVWQNLPEEIALNIIARLLPRRSLVRLRTVWKAWNEMLSSYAAMQRICPNIHLSYTSAFLFQFDMLESGKVHSWVMEGTGDFYKVGEYSYHIANACNTMFCLSNNSDFYLCDEKNRSLKPICDHYSYLFIANAFDSSTDQFIMVVGDMLESVGVYNSSSHCWNEIDLSWGDSDQFWFSGLGVYHRGRFYWLDQLSCNGGVVELNLSDRRWTKIPPPQDAIYRDLENTFENFVDGDIYPSIASEYWDLAGSNISQLILVDREYGFMWELENEEGSSNSKRWRRVDIRLPNEIRLISVNNLGWTVVVGEGIDVYDGNRRLVRKFAIDDVDPQLGIGIKKLESLTFLHLSLEPLLLPFECTYIWWPGHRNF